MKTGTVIALVAIPVVAVGAFLLLRKKPTANAGPVNGIQPTPANYQPGTPLGHTQTPPPQKPAAAGGGGVDVGAQLAVAGVTALPGIIDSVGNLFG
jgi:hypothetical protein